MKMDLTFNTKREAFAMKRAFEADGIKARVMKTVRQITNGNKNGAQNILTYITYEVEKI